MLDYPPRYVKICLVNYSFKFTEDGCMKVLIFSMTVGEGHNMIAKSIAQAFQVKNVETKIVQTFGFNEKEVQRQNKLFLWTCKHIPHIYNYVWNKLRFKDNSTNKLPGYCKKCLPYFKKEISNYNPDIIVCTHFYASSVISFMKKHGMLNQNVLTSTILFDYCLSPYWEHSTNVDFIFQPHTNTTDALLKKGYKESQIKTFGMPARKAFFEKYDKSLIRKQLNLKNIFTVMFIGGGNSLGNTLSLLKSVLQKNNDVQIVVINGKNVKNYKKIECYIKKHNLKNIVNLGFVEFVDLYMKASDVLISRCGGCGLGEIFALKKPFIVREKLIINEKINKQYFIKNGCCLGLNKITEAGEKVKFLKNNPTKLKAMAENIKTFSYPNPAEKITEFLLSQKK